MRSAAAGELGTLISIVGDRPPALMACANRYWLIPIGLRNSSSNTSRGGTSSKSVVVNDFNLFWAGCRPDKAEPELVVDADAVLAMAVSPKRLQAIAWWDLEIVQASGGIKDGELAEGHASEASKTLNRLPLKQGPGVATAKRPDRPSGLPLPFVDTQRGGNRRLLRKAEADANEPASSSKLDQALVHRNQRWNR